MTQKQRHQRFFELMQTLTIAVIFMLVIVTQSSLANANGRKTAQMKTAVAVSPTGDASFNVDFELPLKQYTALKQRIGNATYLARNMNQAMGWSEIKEIKGQFNDTESTINAGLTYVGFAKPYKHGKWEIDLSKEEIAMIAIADNVAHFSGAMETELGATNVILRIKLPAGSSNHKYDDSKNRLTYDFVPEFTEGDDADVDFELDTKAKIMSSLAKIYGSERFDNFWVARSKFHNSGNQTIKNLRIRHRIANMSTWSGWNKTKIVYPGQTVIEPFFPVLDIEKVAGFTSTRNAMVEVEYEYEVDGEKVVETDSQKLEVMARNEVLWNSRPSDECLNFFEYLDNAPVVTAAFCNSNDPVVQEVAAAVSRMINGTPPGDDKTSNLYLSTLWRFMEINKISYQFPPGNKLDGHNLQHVKYPRDVIRNRAGTCIDLAIFWAAVGKAAGMDAWVMNVPGHAFPVFKLPSGNFLPLESTFILKGTFDQAVERGIKNFNEAMQSGKFYLVSIDDMRSKGIHCLDLSKVEEGYLKKLGYKVDLPTSRQTTGGRTNTNTGNNTGKRREQENLCPAKLVGVWRCEIQGNNCTVVTACELKANGTYDLVANSFDAYGNQIESITESGTWAANDTHLVQKANGSEEIEKYRYWFKNNYLMIQFDGSQMAFQRYR